MFTATKFEPHGEHEISISGQIVMCKAVGAWNLEQAKRFVEELKSVVQTCFVEKNKNWLRMMDMSSWQLSTPDAAKHVADYLYWENRHFCIGRYYCFCTSVQKQLLKRKYQTVGGLVLNDSWQDGVTYCRTKLAVCKTSNLTKIH